MRAKMNDKPDFVAEPRENLRENPPVIPLANLCENRVRMRIPVSRARFAMLHPYRHHCTPPSSCPRPAPLLLPFGSITT